MKVPNMQSVISMQSNLNQMKVQVKENTNLLSDLIDIVAKCSDFSVAMRPLERDAEGNRLTGENNQVILDGIDAALSDPECPREVINKIFANFILHRSELNQIMRDKLAKGDSINLDNTDLGYPDFSELDMTERFSAVGAHFYRANFNKTDLTGANLENLDVDEPSAADVVVTGANLDGCNLFGNMLGHY